MIFGSLSSHKKVVKVGPPLTNLSGSAHASVPLDVFLANSAYTDVMPHVVAIHQGLHCWPKYPFRVFQ